MIVVQFFSHSEEPKKDKVALAKPFLSQGRNQSTWLCSFRQLEEVCMCHKTSNSHEILWTMFCAKPQNFPWGGQQSNMPTARMTIAFTSSKRNGMMMMWGKQRQDVQIRFRRRAYYSGHAIVEILVLLQEFNTRQAPCFSIVKRQALIRHKLNCSRLGRNHGMICLRPAKQPRDGGHGVHSGSPLRKNCPVVKHHQRRHKKQHNLGSTRESCVAYYRPALRCGRAS